MKKYLDIIENSVLFKNISFESTYKILNCLSAQKKQYNKGKYILKSGENISSVGMVLSGSVYIIKEDFWGNRSIISEIYPGQIFGEAYACMQSEPIEVSVIASEASEILFLDVQKIITVCSSMCAFHTALINNLLCVMSEKNLMLTKKMEHITMRTTREKLLSYLSSQSVKNLNSTFEISFNRQQLADYLSVDRSAMSNELSKLRDEGILTFEKNKFTLIK